jgi:hypothetical protein
MPPAPGHGNPNDPESYAPNAKPRRARRRGLWAAVGSCVVIIIVVAVGVVMAAGGRTGAEKTSLADAKAALLPLSAMPTGTVQQGTAETGGAATCPATKGHSPQADASRTFAPPGGPELYEEIEIDATRGAAALVNDARKHFACTAKTRDGASYTVYALRAPQVTSGEIAYEIIGPNLYSYVIAAPIDHSAAIAVVSVSNLGAPSFEGTSSFLEHALRHARAELDG